MSSARLGLTQRSACRSFPISGGHYGFGDALPKDETQASAFLRQHPEFDGRGVTIAIFDSGVDPAAAGLQRTPDGRPKVLDIVDCTGSGDVDMSTEISADDEGYLASPLTGTRMRVQPDWRNPSGKWRVGCKRLFDVFTKPLRERIKAHRARGWEEAQRLLVNGAHEQLAAFQRQPQAQQQGEEGRRQQAELEGRIKLLQDLQAQHEDLGPVIDCVVWHDGIVWRAALDTRQLYWDPLRPERVDPRGLLESAPALTNYRLERQFGTFSAEDSLNYVLNIYDNGRTLSIVTDCSPHGTHVAGIAAAHHPESPDVNGVAPGAQIISCKIGDHKLGSMETGLGLTRAVAACLENKCDLVNMSYGEASHTPNRGRFVSLVEELVYKAGSVAVLTRGCAALP